MLSLVLAIAVPRVSAAIPGLTLDQAARRIASELQVTRWKAIARNARARLIVELDRAAYGVQVESEGRFVSEGAERRLPAGVHVHEGGTTRVRHRRVSITFQSRGNTADGATIALGTGDLRRRVVVSAAGRVRIE